MGRAGEALLRLGGTARLTDLLAVTTLWSVRSAEATGEIRRLGRGIYALPGALPEQLAAATAHGVISHQSAAAYWRMDALHKPDSLHVTVPRTSHPVRAKGVTVHFGNTDDEVVTSPLQTVLDCARSLAFPAALAIADSACRLELTDKDRLLKAAFDLRGAGRQRILHAIRHVDPRAANPFESGLRAIVIEAGITGFQPQLVIQGFSSTIRVDLGDERRKIVLEADSFAHHGGRKALEADCRRYDELVRRGWLVLRFAWEQVMFDQTWVAQMVIDTCALR
jgi:very-short-patch-repair endonuclease